MNAVLPDDLSHYARVSKSAGVRDVQPSAADEGGGSSDWDGHSGLEMEPGTKMKWVGPEPLR